ncbi:MAG: aminopeptidase, partial [Conexivisphaera sp.]
MGVDRDYLTGRGFLYADYAPRFQRQYNYRPRSLSLRVSIDVDGRAISGLARYELESWGVLEFDAAEMRIDGVAVDGSPSEFHYNGKVLVIDASPG